MYKKHTQACQFLDSVSFVSLQGKVFSREEAERRVWDPGGAGIFYVHFAEVDLLINNFKNVMFKTTLIIQSSFK